MRPLARASGLIALLATCFLVNAAPAPAAQQGGHRSCEDISQMFVNDISVRGVSCGQAERVIVRYTRAIIDNLQHDWSLTILGFNCDLTRKDYYGDSHRCKAGGDRVIRFRRGTH